MARRQSFRRPRKRIFVGCEGESERGYAAFLSLLAQEADLLVHLDIRLCNGGDPLAIVETAVSEMRRRSRLRGAYVEKAIFLDGDRRRDVPDRATQADRLIQQSGLLAVWSQPALEALLLRHLPGCERLRPATSELALRELKRHWPQYVKAMPAREIRRQLDLVAVRRAAAVEAEPPSLRKFGGWGAGDFAHQEWSFLRSIGFELTNRAAEDRAPGRLRGNRWPHCLRLSLPVSAPSVGFSVGRLRQASRIFKLTQCVE